MPFTLLQRLPAAYIYMKHTCAYITFGFPRTGNLQEVSCPGKDEKQTKKQCLNLFCEKTSVLSACSSLPSVPVPKLRSQGAPHITKSSGSCSRAQTVKIKSTPRAASCLLMGSRPQWPPFGAKPRSCKYSYGVSPGFPPGSFYPPRHAAQQQRGQ